MIRHQWRRYRAKRKFATAPDGLAEAMRGRLERLLSEVYGGRHRHLGVDNLATALHEQTLRAQSSDEAVEWFTLLVLRAPGAARAQQHMDKHPDDAHNKQTRLYELIDFNDAFVSTVLALAPTQRETFVDVARHEIARFCMQLGARMFSDEQFEAITRGLSREVAVYLGALEEGFEAIMTTRAQDALGVDIIVTDPATRRSLNVDCKTSSSFHYRLKDLVREGRITQDEANQADVDGYIQEVNGVGTEATLVTLLRVDPNELGDVKSFVFTQPELLGERLRTLLAKDVQ